MAQTHVVQESAVFPKTVAYMAAVSCHNRYCYSHLTNGRLRLRTTVLQGLSYSSSALLPTCLTLSWLQVEGGGMLFLLFASLNITTHLRHYLLFGPLTHNALHFLLNLQFMPDAALQAILLNNWPPQPCRGFWWVNKHKLIHKSRVPVAGKSLCWMWPECIKLSKMLSSSQEVRIITC